MPRVNIRAVLIGILAGQVALLVVTNGGIDVANAFFGSTTTGQIDGGVVGMSTFLSVILGGFVAGRVASAGGLWQGTMVGIGFILIAIVFQFAQEASIVHDSLTSPGPRSLVDLGPMRIDEVFTGDLLALFGGGFGGWLARRR
jgi:hypothetical protein